MSNELIIRLVAGTFVLIGVILGHFVSPYWNFLPIFVGANLVQSAFTGFCPLEIILKRWRNQR